MSTTNRWPGICDSCAAIVPSGHGVIRYWQGAARRFAPAYAKKSATEFALHALLCSKCDEARK